MTDPMRINAQTRVAPPQPKPVQGKTGTNSGADFAQALADVQGLKFSNHAQKRLQTRNIALTDEGLARLNNAVDKAEKKGGQESLVLMDDLAFIVNVKNRMVVTALDTNQRGEGVFTQIDSVVFADPSKTNPEPEDGAGKTQKA